MLIHVRKMLSSEYFIGAGEECSNNPRIDSTSPCRAAGSTTVDASIKEDTILCVKGIRLGTVSETALIFPDFGDEKPPFAPALDALYSWWVSYDVYFLEPKPFLSSFI